MRQYAPLLRLLAAASLAAATARCHEPTSLGNAGRAQTITAAEIRHWVERLADDSMRGRATPSAELDRAATTIAAYFASLGLQPAFPGSSYIQRFPVPPGSGPATAPIVGALLRGSDYRLSGEYVVIIAHLDGKGVGAPVGLDSIYNGADDNASGTAGVLEIAEALAGTSPHPRRSFLFLVVSGEEEGLWGSQYYVDHPTVPHDSIVAVLNLDMISRNSPDSVQAGGMDDSTLGDQLWAVLEAHPEEGLRVTPGPTTGSDQVPFSSVGVPYLFFFAGLHTDYHRPSDEPDRIDADKAARIARVAFFTALAVGNADTRPQRVTSGTPPAPAGRAVL